VFTIIYVNSSRESEPVLHNVSNDRLQLPGTPPQMKTGKLPGTPEPYQDTTPGQSRETVARVQDYAAASLAVAGSKGRSGELVEKNRPKNRHP
jgi:hypothetical protein